MSSETIVQLLLELLGMLKTHIKLLI